MTLMSDNYKVKVNDSFSFDINKESISKLDAANWGKPFACAAT
jgi:hypothetical protein